MNKIKITKNEILDKALEMAKENGLEKISIRGLSKKCDVSVGCIYYYFQDKNEMIVELIRRFWDDIFIPISKMDYQEYDFVDFLRKTYSVLLMKLGENNLYSNSHMNMFSKSNIDLGRNNMGSYKDNILKFFMQKLDEDNKISPSVWNENFKKYEFANFIFKNLFISLDKREKNIDLLCYVIEKIIY